MSVLDEIVQLYGIFLFTAAEWCTEALISGRKYNIPDNQFRASSANDSNHKASVSRFDYCTPGTSYCGWVAMSTDPSPWIEVCIDILPNTHTCHRMKIHLLWDSIKSFLIQPEIICE